MQNSEESYENLTKLASSFNQVATTLTITHQNFATCSRPRPGLRAAHGRLGRGRPKQKQSIMQKTFLEFWFIGSAGSG